MTPVEGIDYYINERGLLVMTEASHLLRGACCGNRCLHCPYEYANVAGYPEPVYPLNLQRARPSDADTLMVLTRQTFMSSLGQRVNEVRTGLLPYLSANYSAATMRISLQDRSARWWLLNDQRGFAFACAKLNLSSQDQGGGLLIEHFSVRRQLKQVDEVLPLLIAIQSCARMQEATSLKLQLPLASPLTPLLARSGWTQDTNASQTIGTQVLELAGFCKQLVD